MNLDTIKLLPLCLSASLISGLVCAQPKLLPVLDGKTIQFQVTDAALASNPNRGIQYDLHFGKHDYSYEDSSTKSTVTGKYQYQILDNEKGIALIHLHEQYQHQKSDYNILVYAQDDHSGLYIYKQIEGPVKPDVRMNAGSFNIKTEK